jgi:CRISPR-associated protein Cst1
MSEKSDPTALTHDDLTSCASRMEQLYFGGPLGTFLTCVFPNSEYVQPGDPVAKAAKRQQYSQEVLFAFNAPPPKQPAPPCAFSGEPSTHRINRVHMPLLTGKDVLNFFPNAEGGLNIAGPYLTALQALPLGGRRCEGRLLIAYADHPTLTLQFARRYWQDNLRLLNLATANQLPLGKGPDPALPREAAAEGKYPDAKSPRTLLLHDLQEILQETATAKQFEVDLQTTTVTAYWLSNSGQGPSLDLFHIGNHCLRTLAKANLDPVGPLWRQLLRSGWPAPNAKKKSAPTLVGPGRTANTVLNQLFEIFEDGVINPEQANAFVRYKLLGRALSRDEFLTWAAKPSWLLTAFFLGNLIGMNQQRLDRIRTFSDRLAQYIEVTNDRGLLRTLLNENKDWLIRNALIKAQRRSASSELLFGLDEFLNVFFAEEGMGMESPGLIRDLIAIRLTEKLHQSGFFQKTGVIEELSNDSAA